MIKRERRFMEKKEKGMKVNMGRISMKDILLHGNIKKL